MAQLQGNPSEGLHPAERKGNTVDALESALVGKYLQQLSAWQESAALGRNEPRPSLEAFVVAECQKEGIDNVYLNVLTGRVRQRTEQLLTVSQNATCPEASNPALEVPTDHPSVNMARQLLGNYELIVPRKAGHDEIQQAYAIRTVYPYDTVGARSM